MPFNIIRQDITKMTVDAIVNSANTLLQMGGGACGSIFKAAGEEQLKAACEALAPIQMGEAVITPGFNLPAKYIIHAAGPAYHVDEAEKCEKLLTSAYTSALELAVKHDCKSIAFPLISSGIYSYPKTEALQVATRAINAFLETHDLEVYLLVFARDTFLISKDLQGDIASYIDEHYVAEHFNRRRGERLLDVEYRALRAEPPPPEAEEDDDGVCCDLFQEEREIRPEDLPAFPEPPKEPRVSYSIPPARPLGLLRSISASPKPAAKLAARSLEDFIGHLDEAFNITLVRLITKKGIKNADVYKRANITKDHFSKIISGKIKPKKKTVCALAIALRLNLEETRDLLSRAGFSLTHNEMFDVIIEYFIIHQRYDVFEINNALFTYDQQLLGAF